LAGARPLVVIRRVEQAPEVLEREFRVDRDEAVAESDDGVDTLAAPEGVLQAEMRRRKDLAEEVPQEQLAEAATELRGPQDIVQAGDVSADLVDPAGCLAQLAEALLDVAEHARRVVEPLVHLPRE